MKRSAWTLFWVVGLFVLGAWSCSDPSYEEEQGECRGGGCDEGGVCEDRLGVYVELLEQSQKCRSDTDCGAYNVGCGVGGVRGSLGCNAPINMRSDFEELDGLKRSVADCSPGDCVCDSEVGASVCVDEVCTFARSCGKYDHGEWWNNEEGCLCTCVGGEEDCLCDAPMCGDYTVGETWEDACGNECVCTAGGASCTLLACDLCGEYTIGESWVEGCSTCTCTEHGPVCSDDACGPCDGREPGQNFPAGDGCNTCVCDEQGGVVCTEEACNDACVQIEETYRQIYEASYTGRAGGDAFCTVDEDCRVFEGPCSFGIDICSLVSSVERGTAELDQIADAYRSNGCGGENVCDCSETLEVACVDDTCVVVE